MIDVMSAKLLICISVFLLCGGLYLFTLRRGAGKILLVGAVGVSLWYLVSIFVGMELFALFAQLFVGGVLVGAEVTMIALALRPTSDSREEVEDDDEIIDFGFDPSEEAEESSTPNVVSDPMDAAVEKWLAKRGYLDSGVTIITMSAELKTNRTYLSTYINKRYGESFRDWVTSLRIEEAKVLLRDQDLSISDVAQRTGFASATTFSRAFARMESITPTEWRSR